MSIERLMNELRKDYRNQNKETYPRPEFPTQLGDALIQFRNLKLDSVTDIAIPVHADGERPAKFDAKSGWILLPPGTSVYTRLNDLEQSECLLKHFKRRPELGKPQVVTMFFNGQLEQVQGIDGKLRLNMIGGDNTVFPFDSHNRKRTIGGLKITCKFVRSQ